MSEDREDGRPVADSRPPPSDGAGPRVKVLRAITRLNVGGPTRHVEILMAGLSPSRFDHELACGLTPPSEGPSQLDVAGRPHVIEALQRAPHPLRDIRAYRELRRWISDRSPEIVHTHQGKAGALGRLAAHREKVPSIIHTCHGHTFEHYFGRLKGRAVHALERMATKRSHAMIVQSPLQARELQTHMGALVDGKIVLIPPALPGKLLDRLRAAPQQRQEARHQLGIQNDAWVVTLPARLVDIKRPLRAIRLASALRKSMPRMQLLIAGDGELREAVAREIRLLGLEQQAKLLGYVNDVPTLYAASDLVILTSANEGTPLCLYEAMAAGTAVAATDVGGVRDVLAGQGCLLPPQDSEEDWAQSIMSWWHGEPREGQAQRARQRVLAEQNPARLVGQVSALYEDLLANGKVTLPFG